jgi:multidrug efflux system outer membrane protein
MFKRTVLSAVSIATLTFITACGALGTGPAYERPVIETPAALGTLRSSTGANADWLQWWKGFQDPVLDALMQEAAANSQDLVLATARVNEARATLDQNKANLYPTVDLNAAATRKRISENTATYSSAIAPVSDDRLVGLNASYEIDFWGKYAKADEAARARLLSQSAARATVLTTLYSNVAQSYFALRAFDVQTQLAEATLVTRQENVRLQKRRLDAGLIGQLDFSQAESEAASVLATLQAARQNRSNAESALAALLGRKPADILQPKVVRGETLGDLYARQAVPGNLPADLISRRPDIVAAEQNLIAANADIGQARSAYFPKISITAGVGQQSAEMANLFDPASLFWNMVGNLAQPVFRAGAIGALVAASNARQQQALAQYTQSVQSAFRDVHDAMNNVDAGKDIATTTAQRIAALRETLRLSEMRYKAGYSSYLEVLSAQRDLSQAESALVDVQRSQLASLVSLYKAVGGGWDAGTLTQTR